jgi:RNA polymerase sigma-70 factor (ECF subfamily)
MTADKKSAVYSDEELVEGCLKRDNHYREALYLKYSKDLYQYALRYAGSVEEAEDVLQEAFLLIFERMGQFRRKGNLSAWMRTIVIREALHHYKKTLGRWQKELPLEEESPENGYETMTLPYHQLDYQTLLNLIQELPDGYRMVFNLCEIEGYDYKEAAEMLHCSQATCRSQLMRAKLRLRQKIEALENK